LGVALMIQYFDYGECSVNPSRTHHKVECRIDGALEFAPEIETKEHSQTSALPLQTH